MLIHFLGKYNASVATCRCPHTLVLKKPERSALYICFYVMMYVWKKHFCLYIYHYKLKVKSRPLLFLQTYKLLTKTRFVTCVRNIATQVIAMSNALHSSNQTVFVVLSLLLIIKHKQIFVLKAYQSFWWFNGVLFHNVPRFLWKIEPIHTFWIVNTMERRMQNFK